jgi:hypothetical protein
MATEHVFSFHQKGNTESPCMRRLTRRSLSPVIWQNARHPLCPIHPFLRTLPQQTFSCFPNLKPLWKYVVSEPQIFRKMSLIRQTACACAQFSGCSSTTNAHSETGQMAVCCQNLTLGAFSNRSTLSVLVGALFKKFGLFLNTHCAVAVFFLPLFFMQNAS